MLIRIPNRNFNGDTNGDFTDFEKADNRIRAP